MNLEAGLSTAERVLAADENLKRAVSYVSEAWFPINPQRLDQVKSSLASGKYNENRDLLVQDISEDYALFIFCVRKLSGLVSSRNDEIMEWVDPIEIFHHCSLEEVQKVLDVEPDFISQHRLDQVSEFQAERISEAMASAQVARTFAHASKTESNLSYACALFRQLGLALIAWNYPHVYSRVVGAMNGSVHSNIDSALSKRLGFSPAMLGIALARTWCLRPGVRLAMGDGVGTELISESEKILAATLAKTCEVAEAFARGNNTERYPNAKGDWEKAKTALEQVLGPSALDKIQKEIQKGLALYLKAAPALFKDSVIETPTSAPVVEAQPQAPQTILARKIADNLYVKHCPESMQKKFEELYSKFSHGAMLKDSVDFLVQEIILPLGFRRGCVYLIEPDLVTLLPRLSIGETKLTEFEAINYKAYTSLEHPVAIAFKSDSAMAHGIKDASERAVQAFTAVLGKQQRVGVLYLEPSLKLSADPLANPMAYFKAIREALSDCLNLS